MDSELRTQQLAALAEGNRIRQARARLKAEIGSGKRNPQNVLRKIPAYAGGMKVEQFVRSIPGLGPHKAQRLLCRCQIGPTMTLEGMTDRQRRLLAYSIRERKWL